MCSVTASSPELSVVLLGYRSGATLAALVQRTAAVLDEAAIDWEAVLVANFWPGDGDETPVVARTLAALSPRLRVLAEPKAGGMGWDARRGLAAAHGRCVAVFDGDGQVTPGDLVRAYRALVEANLDLIVARRVARGDGLLRAWQSRLFNAAFAGLFGGSRWRDVNAKPKVLTRAAWERMHLTSDGWFFDAELLLEARRLGLRGGELPTTFGALSGRDSFVGPRAVLEFVVEMLRHRFAEWRRGLGA